MRSATVTLLLIFACLTCVHRSPAGLDESASKDSTAKPTLEARMEIDKHEHSFTVRFYLKNTGEHKPEVVYGRGGSGLEVVPHFRLGYLYITPPTYLSPSRRALRRDKFEILARKEILYGTFTLGYPTGRFLEREKTFSGFIRFQEFEMTIHAKPVEFEVPEEKRATPKVVPRKDKRKGTEDGGKNSPKPLE
jgi:hypothetical protein